MKSIFTIGIVFFLATNVSLLTGCGGGNNDKLASPPTATATPPVTPATVVPRLAIGWGERSRATGGLNSALSAVVRLQGAKPDGSDLVFTVNRAATLPRYDSTETAPEAARLGSWPLTVTFFAEANGGGPVVGVAQAQVSLTNSGLLPDVTVSAVITQVEVTPGQQVTASRPGFGSTTELQWTARASDGTIVPVTPGSALFTVIEGGDNLRISGGQAQGVLPGPASVTVRVDGVTSAPAVVHVTSQSVVTVMPNPAVVSVNKTLQFSAQVTQTYDSRVTWSVVETGGGTIDSFGLYRAPATAGTYTVRAVSHYDPEKSATVAVSVQDDKGQ